MNAGKRWNAAGIIGLIKRHSLRVFSTTDLQTLSGLTPAAATQALKRLEKNGLVTRIKRGVWVNRLATDFNSFEAAAHLSAPWPSYISLYSSLSAHGKIEEVPQIIYAVSAAPPRRWKTPVGNFHFHRLPPHLIWGFETKISGEGSYLLAEPEKAFLDLVYLALTPRSPLELPYQRNRRWNFDRQRLRAYAAKFSSERLTAYLRKNKLI